MKIEHVDSSNSSSMLEFLKAHENFSLFLLNNFESYGSKLSEAPYSGNFKIVRSNGAIVAVFCLTKKGSLLIETSFKEPLFNPVLASCKEEGISISALVGNWDFCHPFWNFLKDQSVIQKETFHSKDILYMMDLSEVSPVAQTDVQLLKEADFDQWKPLRLAYVKEIGFPNQLTDQQLLGVYQEKIKNKIAWGYFSGEKLVSIADLNAKAQDLGQVGGVYTIPTFRQRGYSRAVMNQLLLDAKNRHSLRKLMIFTGENNLTAQKLYEDLGARHSGSYMALFFGH